MNNIKKDLRDNLIENVIKWADDKGILKEEYIFKQILKKDEELGELSKALFNDDTYEIIDALGDIQVTLIINANVRDVKLIDNYSVYEINQDLQHYYTRLHKSVSECGSELATSYNFSKAFHYVNKVSECLGLDSVDCLKVAYDVISKRKTKTIDGKVLKL